MYEVKIRKTALKQLSKIPLKDALRLSKELQKLAVNPRPEGSIKLLGFKNQYRIRIGNYRAIYSIEYEVSIVEITKIGDRKSIYKIE